MIHHAYLIPPSLTPQPHPHPYPHPAPKFKRIFLNENVRISIQFSLRFIPKSSIDNESALVQVMACRLLGDKPLPKPMLALFIDA